MTTALTLPLYEAGIEYARNELKHREKSLKAMRASLVLLDAYMPELRARDAAPDVAYILWNSISRSLSISTDCRRKSRNLMDALLALGFGEVNRNDYGGFAHVNLKKGRLKICLTVWTEKGAS